MALSCSYCSAGLKPALREATGEWTHTVFQGRQVTHCLCVRLTPPPNRKSDDHTTGAGKPGD